MANWLDNFSDGFGNVLEIAQDVIDTVSRLDPPTTVPITPPSPAPVAPQSGSVATMGSNDMLLLFAVAVLLILWLG